MLVCYRYVCRFNVTHYFYYIIINVSGYATMTRWFQNPIIIIIGHRWLLYQTGYQNHFNADFLGWHGTWKRLSVTSLYQRILNIFISCLWMWVRCYNPFQVIVQKVQVLVMVTAYNLYYVLYETDNYK